MSSSGGAFLTSAILEKSQPSPFEVTAESHLSRTLHPAFEHVLKVIAEWSPQSCSVYHRFSDEVYMLGNGVLQLYYLKVYQATFTQNFYGLQQTVKDGRKFPINLSFLCAIVFPYVRKKLENFFMKQRENLADGIKFKIQALNRMTEMFVLSYPYVHMLFESLNLAMFLAFSLKKSKFHNLFSFLVGVHLTYITPEEAKSKQFEEEELLSTTKGLKKIVLNSVRGGAKALTFFLEVGTFFLQFLDFWYNNQDERSSGTLPNSSMDQLPPPPPILDVEGRLCPICQKKRRGETVLSSSGLVFCYVCIVKEIRSGGKCPVTGLSAQENQLVRLFPPE